ncbi:hypothetical protein [Streptomyces yaizuensis]|uniref:Secreted protein n=1 Tax=Streptomyces yaizuensis TaxID=2989713 RepID=A0ABQ5PAJ2_9ACTN|nr:hypothetical protein [Streptomyces sp. YSPA8]GLF99596.1 hypothetical protein SYYSPA8_34885 [Streptomyces sp. YSPA8]
MVNNSTRARRTSRAALVAAVTLAMTATTASVLAAPAPPAPAAGLKWNVSTIATGDTVGLGATRPDARKTWVAGMLVNRTASGALAGFTPTLWERDERTGTGWKKVATDPASASADIRFNDIDAVSARQALVVGDQTDDADGIVTQHWNGKRWRTVLAPVPNGTRTAGFLTVEHLDAKNAWATGWTQIGTDIGTQFQHWDGKRWKPVKLPDLGTGPDGDFELRSVSAQSPKNVVAVGGLSTGGQAKPLVLHFDGTRWKKAALPSLGRVQARLLAVATGADGTAWAVGETRSRNGASAGLVLRYDGKKWTRPALPKDTPALASVALSKGDPVLVARTDEEHFPGLIRAGKTWKSLGLPATHGGRKVHVQKVVAHGNTIDVLGDRLKGQGQLTGPQLVLTARR